VLLQVANIRRYSKLPCVCACVCLGELLLVFFFPNYFCERIKKKAFD
jgi:hypothetical protein